MSESVDLQSFLAGFIAEATEHLDAAHRNLGAVAVSLRHREANPRAVRELFRSLHTIKGLAGMVGVDPIVDLAHAMEAVLRAADRGGGRLGPAAVDALVKALGAIEERVRALEKHAPVRPAPTALLDALQGLEPAEQPVEGGAAEQLLLPPELRAKLSPAETNQLLVGLRSGRRALRVDFVPSPARAEAGLTITTVRERVARVAEIVKVLPISLPPTGEAPGGLAFALLLLTGSTDAELAEAAATTTEQLQPLHPDLPAIRGEDDDALGGDAPDRQRGGHVRVEVARLDDALEKLSALVVTRFRLTRAVAALAAKGADVRALQEIVAENARQLRDLRASIMRARMVPVAELLERVPLIVRGLGQATGKSVRVEIAAGGAELDKAVGERLVPAIVHLVRNAVDHALEPKEERERRGKPAEGLVRVACFERSNSQLELTVTDDGRGIDREEVARRAHRSVPATDEALLELIAQPGLTTLDAATHTSGRGLGVDIVKRICVEELGGELALRTERGAGTTFTLRVPLSITIVDAFSFACGEERFVVPVSMVEEIVELEPSRIVRGSPRPGAFPVRLFERRGEHVPLVALEAALGLGARAEERRKALVVRRQGQACAFAVDRMLGQQEVVVRPLEDALVKVAGITGATDLGDGRPTLVLDLVALAATLAARRPEALS